MWDLFGARQLGFSPTLSSVLYSFISISWVGVARNVIEVVAE